MKLWKIMYEILFILYTIIHFTVYVDLYITI